MIPTGVSLDHLIRPQQERLGDRQAKGFGRLEVDDQFERGGSLERQVSRFRALENLVDKDGPASQQIRTVRSIDS